MAGLSFDVLKHAWEKLTKDRIDDLTKLAPSLTEPGEIFMKNISSDDTDLVVQFLGLENATTDAKAIPQLKRTIMNWVKKFAMQAQAMRSDPSTLIVKISKELRFSESKKIFTGSEPQKKMNVDLSPDDKYDRINETIANTKLTKIVVHKVRTETDER